MSIPTITIDGDRISGKTHAAIAVATTDAADGRQVLATTRSSAAATELFHQAARMIPTQKIAKAIRSCGQQRIELNSGGGRIYFRTRTATSCRGVDVDTLILDEWDYDDSIFETLIPSLFASNDPRIVISKQADR
ncbi:hypothetical protein [Gordonia sp. (in: high G+C Gram-positive bacteria)]|uniref:hypothetical protein n=1 Tax=Gordonia sp. (in: high G+C Gram-positive bacteria) TaxID=84139 RepID=UPI003C785897